MNRVALGMFAALFAAAPTNAQQAWWTPVSISPEIPRMVAWWTPCECENCGDELAQKVTYSKAYDEAVAKNKALVLFVGQPLKQIPDAVCVRYDGAELPPGVKSPAVIVGRGCNGRTINRTALLPGEATERQIKDALRQQPVCPTCPQQEQPFRVGSAQPELNGMAGLLAAAMLCTIEGVDDAKQAAEPPASFVSAPLAGSCAGDGEAVCLAARRTIAPLRRLLSLPFRAIRSARANRVELVPVEQSSIAATTVTRFESVPVATFSFQPVTENVPVTRYRWIETPLAAMPAKK